YKEIKNIKNLIISEAAPDKTVEWNLTNIIFTDDMSELKNKSKADLKGIVYFKSYPYNNTTDVKDLNAYGIVKLDKLSYTFRRDEAYHNILDLRGVKKEDIDKYTSNNCIAGGARFVYFSKELGDSIKNEDEAYKKAFYKKFAKPNVGYGGIDSEYFGDNGVRQDSYGANKDGSEGISSRTPRKLKEFEYYGNNDKYEISARDTFKDHDEDFQKLTTHQQNLLDQDKNSDARQIAKVTTLCPLC
ncbi:MAG: hypothetical protein K2N31_06820, partial [Treponemataceae bacterium]|nr:hypothetical protein [Treponemataceae bacterium]